MIVTDNSETLKNALARIEQLERENAALLADARRYAWLKEVCLKHKDGAVEVYEFIAPIVYGETIDAAIDAAMKE